MKKLLSDELIGFVLGVVFIGCVAYYLMPEASVLSVIRLLVCMYSLDCCAIAVLKE